MGTLSIARHRGGGCTSSTHGYMIGGHNNGTNYDRIDKYQYSSDANASDVGNATADTRYVGVEDETHGYVDSRSGDVTQVQRFSFSVDGNSTDVGNLNRDGTNGFGSTSFIYGYISNNQSSADDIQKHTFSSSVVVTDVGNLSTSRHEGSTGTQG